MRSSRRTTPHVAENSMVDDATDACSLCCIFATFLTNSSTSLGCPYFYLIQSNGWKSLCLLTGLSVQDYSKLLLQSKLVRDRNNKDGSRSIRVDRDDWNTFLGRFLLRGDIYGKGGCVELTDWRINYTAIERTMGGRIDHTTTNLKSATMCVLRVGAVGPGETLAEICVTVESKKLKLFVRSWKSRMIWMSWMNLQSWKQHCLGSLWHDTSQDKPRQDKPSQEGWLLYDNSSMHHHKNGSLYPSRAATRWAKMRRVETSQDKTRGTKQIDCCMIIHWYISIKWVHFTDNTSKNSVLYFCFVALCGYWEMTWCWEGGDFVVKMATVVMPGE